MKNQKEREKCVSWVMSSTPDQTSSKPIFAEIFKTETIKYTKSNTCELIVNLPHFKIV